MNELENKPKIIHVDPLVMLNGGKGALKNLLRTFGTSLEEIADYPIQNDSLFTPEGWGKAELYVFGNGGQENNFKVNQNGEDISLLNYKAKGDNKTYLSLALHFINTNFENLKRYKFSESAFGTNANSIKEGEGDLYFGFKIKLKDGNIVEDSYETKEYFQISNNKRKITFSNSILEENIIKRTIYEKEDFSTKCLSGTYHTARYDNKGNLVKVTFQERSIGDDKKKGYNIKDYVYELEDDSLILKGRKGIDDVFIDMVDEKWPREIKLQNQRYHCIIPKKDWISYHDENMFEQIMEIDRGFKNIKIPKSISPIKYNFQTTPVDFDEFMEQIQLEE